VATTAVIILSSILAFTWTGFWSPYKFHLLRGGQDFNVYYFFERLNAPQALPAAARRTLNVTFLALEFSILPILWFRKMTSLSDVFRYAFLAIVIFIVFARVSSPEWVLWYLPVGLMFARRTKTLLLLAVLGLWYYVVCPVAFLTLWPSTAYSSIALARDVMVVTLAAMVLGEPDLSLPAASAR
jgi:hypothetical protein